VQILLLDQPAARGVPDQLNTPMQVEPAVTDLPLPDQLTIQL
jgi:hypothetical protein